MVLWRGLFAQEVPMSRLVSIVYALTGPTLAGIFMTVALVIGRDDLISILVAVGTGFVLGLPAAWVIGKKLSQDA
jgi:hypothetical protein